MKIENLKGDQARKSIIFLFFKLALNNFFLRLIAVFFLRDTVVFKILIIMNMTLCKASMKLKKG